MSDFSGGPVIKNLLANTRTQVWTLVQEDLTCCGATKPTSHFRLFYVLISQPTSSQGQSHLYVQSLAHIPSVPCKWECPSRRLWLLALPWNPYNIQLSIINISLLRSVSPMERMRDWWQNSDHATYLLWDFKSLVS